jgi:hypothetical protein
MRRLVKDSRKAWHFIFPILASLGVDIGPGWGGWDARPSGKFQKLTAVPRTSYPATCHTEPPRIKTCPASDIWGIDTSFMLIILIFFFNSSD